jgi:chemotaxis protein methyltransferase CheR/type IV pilus assembly protein PilK
MEAWLQPLPAALTDQQFAAWQQLIETRTGIDFSQHRAILQGGLSRRLRELGQVDHQAYFEQVSRWPEGVAEWQALIEQVAVKETSFFRQPAAFELVRSFLRKRCLTGTTLDLWSAGCATGEEAYGLAMVTADIIKRQQAACFFGVLATDMCSVALQHARAGSYRSRRIEEIPELFRRRFASVDGDRLQIADDLRQRLCFAQVNLLDIEQLPALPMDVIYCQNVLVYFRRERVKRVLDAMVERLKPGGLLVLGPGEAAHWQHPAMARTAHQGVSAWLRRTDSSASQNDLQKVNTYGR